ncbi:MAG: ATP-dependent RecD-like DNA helicase [Lachnospiraceae bacterium]|nr:ATP-dependent RecD-like DNA helicase [Lachnospiraceae bacterium]MCI9099293.1 ATP-dependent RecD-like DNA helicase [Lachnospiraceae bacterium]MCI9358759.1 ATP-dependent RecD-like DNA helicase [Lachnospiraceae bacterium]
MADTISGFVDHIIYRNEENGYTVLVLATDGEEITCVGTFRYMVRGEMIEAQGHYTRHPVYGKQFQIESFQMKAPEDTKAMERYLGSGAIKGVGASLASRIVKCFGEDTIRVLEEEPERLSEVKGISERMAREIALQMEEKTDMRKAMIFLQKYGISLNLGAKIYKQYGQELYQMLRENPYQMAEDIPGVGFRIADEIAGRIGIRPDSGYRIKSGLLYILLQASGQGHVYLPRQELIRQASTLLQAEEEILEKYLMDLAIERKAVIKDLESGPVVYGNRLYHLELDTARLLWELNVQFPHDPIQTEEQIRQMEKKEQIQLDECQRAAVREAAGHGLFILTGGPGTGKTTTINALLHYFEGENLEIRLAAPTGRAANRMTEASGYEAQTIHRLLELSSALEEQTSSVQFERNAQNPLEADVVIIDEMSMVDIYLMHALLSAVGPGTRLILVGDVDQLPSVGPGNVLRDMIDARVFPVIELKRIFRQASQSDIIVNAHKINRGEQVPVNNKSRDFFFLERREAVLVLRVVIALIQEKLPRYIQADPMDIQVLTPMRKGVLGVEQLNPFLQKYMNPPSPSKKEKEYGHTLYRQGDKVMQIKNNYQLPWEVRGKFGITVDKGAGVFNGDIGTVREINEFAGLLTVEYDQARYVDYSFKQLDELELAYAVTIHKSQGSEYPAVVIPLLGGPQMLMNRNLLYTAVTRARKCVAIVGSGGTFQNMIANKRELERYSALDIWIQELGNTRGEFGEKGS